MPSFTTLEGQTLQYGQEGAYTLKNQQAFILELDKQVRAADPTDEGHIKALQKNLNYIVRMLGMDTLPETGVLDVATVEALDYFKQKRDTFIEHGIENHVDATELEALTNPAFTETEYAPTMEEMKSLEVEIDKLYED